VRRTTHRARYHADLDDHPVEVRAASHDAAAARERLRALHDALDRLDGLERMRLRPHAPWLRMSLQIPRREYDLPMAKMRRVTSDKQAANEAGVAPASAGEEGSVAGKARRGGGALAGLHGTGPRALRILSDAIAARREPRRAPPAG
jgi:hypothetical protein